MVVESWNFIGMKITTIRPQLGIATYADSRQISFADLPGLIEGAHANYGKGHKFLRHVERTKLLLLLVDLNGFQLNYQSKYRSCIETILLLNKELELYKESLLDKPFILLLNKCDLANDDQIKETLDQVRNLKDHMEKLPKYFHPDKLIEFDHVDVISAKDHIGINNVLNIIRDLLDYYHAQNENELNVNDKQLLLPTNTNDKIII